MSDIFYEPFDNYTADKRCDEVQKELIAYSNLTKLRSPFHFPLLGLGLDEQRNPALCVARNLCPQ